MQDTQDIISRSYLHESIASMSTEPQYSVLWTMTLRYPCITATELDEHMLAAQLPWGEGMTQRSLDDPGYLCPVMWGVLFDEAFHLSRQPYINDDCPREGYGDGN